MLGRRPQTDLQFVDRLELVGRLRPRHVFGRAGQQLDGREGLMAATQGTSLPRTSPVLVRRMGVYPSQARTAGCVFFCIGISYRVPYGFSVEGRLYQHSHRQMVGVSCGSNGDPHRARLSWPQPSHTHNPLETKY